MILTQGNEIQIQEKNVLIFIYQGTGGDILILEEAAYVDSGFFYETVAPLLMMGWLLYCCF